MCVSRCVHRLRERLLCADQQAHVLTSSKGVPGRTPSFYTTPSSANISDPPPESTTYSTNPCAPAASIWSKEAAKMNIVAADSSDSLVGSIVPDQSAQAASDGGSDGVLSSMLMRKNYSKYHMSVERSPPGGSNVVYNQFVDNYNLGDDVTLPPAVATVTAGSLPTPILRTAEAHANRR